MPTVTFSSNSRQSKKIFAQTKQLWIPTKREEDGSWRKLHNDELHSLYSSPNIVRVIKSGRMWWAGHGGGERCLQGFWLGGPKGRDHWKGLGVDGRVTLRWT
jgi:hypothetical protein